MPKSTDFYIYAYIDPITNEPFYIGKGQGSRAYKHLRRSSYQQIHDTFFYRKLREMLCASIQPMVDIIKDDLTEEVACDVESILIHLIGTRANGTGPLCNQYTSCHGNVSEFTLQSNIKTGHIVKAWGKIFPSITAVSHDPRCLVSIHALRYRLKSGLSIEDAATRQERTWWSKPPKPLREDKIICWGKEFDSRIELARDPRCKVTSQQLYNRIAWGWDTESAATTPLYQ